jgi:hypothetical protein
MTDSTGQREAVSGNVPIVAAEDAWLTAGSVACRGILRGEETVDPMAACATHFPG